MALALALVESTALFVAAYLVIGPGTAPSWGQDVAVAAVLGQSMAVCACCLVCFYYNDL